MSKEKHDENYNLLQTLKDKKEKKQKKDKKKKLSGPITVLKTRKRKNSAGRSAGRSSAARVSSASPKKNHLIDAAPFGRLNQMPRPIFSEKSTNKEKKI